MEVELKPGERIDDLQRDGLRIIQDPERFCFGMDAVLLSGFATAADPVKGIAVGNTMEGKRVLDMGTGTGILPILLSSKTKASELIGLEIQEDSAEMAKRSVDLNDLSPRVSIVCGDIKEASSIFGAASFDAITCNPPYMIGGHGLQNPDSPKAIARHEVMCTLADVCRAAAFTLKSNGKFFMVHRPNRLVDIFYELRKVHLEPKRMWLVYPYENSESNMVLLESVKGGKTQLIVEKPLIVYKDKNIYSDEILRIYANS